MAQRGSKRWIKWLVLTLIPVVIIGGALYAFFVLSHQPSETDTPTHSKNTQDTTAYQQEVSKKIYAIAQSSGTDKGLAAVDQELKKTDNKAETAYLYSVKLGLESSKPNPDGSKLLEYALAAEQSSPTSGSALDVANLYEAQGDKQEAVKYYRLYLERATADESLNEDQKVYYEAHIKELES